MIKVRLPFAVVPPRDCYDVFIWLLEITALVVGAGAVIAGYVILHSRGV